MRKGLKHSEKTKLKMSLSQTGRKHSEETLKKMSESNKGEKHYRWSGDNISKSGVHLWLVKNFGRPMVCDNCKTTTAKKFEWANKFHTYKRKIEDYMRLCTSCHRKYDIKNNGVEPYFTKVNKLNK